MSLLVGVGSAKEHDAHQAGFVAGKSALERAGAEGPMQLLVFSSAIYDQEALVRGVRDAAGNAPLVGCSAAGILTAEGPLEGSVAVAAIGGDAFTFASGIGLMKQGARAAGALVAQEIREIAGADLRGLLLFANMLSGGAAEALLGVGDVLGESAVPIAGAAAGDELLFERTFQYRDALVSDNALVGLALAGSGVFGIAVRHGWVPVGTPLRVTRAEGSRLIELEGKPAVSLYEAYFGEDIQELRAEPLARSALGYPLGISTDDGSAYMIRNPLRVNEDGSLLLTAPVPEGAEVRLMIGSKEKALAAAHDAAADLIEHFRRSRAALKLVVMFESVSRKKLLADAIKDEASAVLEMVGRDTPLLGVASFGEFAPPVRDVRKTTYEPSQFHNGTITMVGIGAAHL
jgi:hypothetical protein